MILLTLELRKITDLVPVMILMVFLAAEILPQFLMSLPEYNTIFHYGMEASVGYRFKYSYINKIHGSNYIGSAAHIWYY